MAAMNFYVQKNQFNLKQNKRNPILMSVQSIEEISTDNSIRAFEKIVIEKNKFNFHVRTVNSFATYV